MTTESVAPETLHAWAICLQASEEARRRGDRRTGTDHILLALFEDPSIEVVLGVSLQQARQALESLDHEALGALGLGSGTDAPPLPMRAVPKKPRIRDIAQKDRLRMTPAAKKVLEEASSPIAGGFRSRPSRCWPRSSLSNRRILRRCCWALSASTRQRFGVDWMRSRPTAESPATSVSSSEGAQSGLFLLAERAPALVV